jgi:hypothetical protein
VLGSRYLAGLTPNRRPSSHLLLIGWCFDLRCTRLICGGIAKIRGWRRGCCSADGTASGTDVGASARMVCCRGLNRSSAFWRARLIL